MTRPSSFLGLSDASRISTFSDAEPGAGSDSYMLIPHTHFPPSPSLPTRWTSCGHVQVAGKKSQTVYGYFRKSLGKNGIRGLSGCWAAIFSRSSTLFFHDFSESSIRSCSNAFFSNDDADEDLDMAGRYGSSAELADSSLWKRTIMRTTTIKAVITRPS